MEEKIVYEEREKKAGSGALALILIIILLLASIGAAILGSVLLSDEQNSSPWGAVFAHSRYFSLCSGLYPAARPKGNQS